MCLKQERSVSEEKHTGYVVQFKEGDIYHGIFYSWNRCALGIEETARDDVESYDILSPDAGFYGFDTLESARKYKTTLIPPCVVMEIYIFRTDTHAVILKAEFFDVFARGFDTINGEEAFRARRRTLLEEVK